MSLDDGFKKIIDGMRLADEGRAEVMTGLEEAWAERKTLDATISDLQEIVEELRRVITEQGDTLREQGEELQVLRARLDSGTTQEER